MMLLVAISLFSLMCNFLFLSLKILFIGERERESTHKQGRGIERGRRPTGQGT